MRCVVVLLFLLLSWIAPAIAADGGSPPAACLTSILDAERGLRLPPGLLPAIARVESGRPDPATGRVQPWPWTINAEGVGHFFATKDEAIAAVEALQARGVRSIDVGCMQVNLLHHPTAFSSLDAAFDPAANAAYAGRFLAGLYGQAASWPIAAGYYHSQTPDLADGYRRLVMLAWGRPDLAGPAIGTAGAAGTIAAAPVTAASAYRAFVAEPAPRSAYGAFARAGVAYGAFAPAASTAKPLLTAAAAKSTPAPARMVAAAPQSGAPKIVRLASAR